MQRFIGRCQAGGITGDGRNAARGAGISPSLGIAVFEIGRLWETGGPGYVKAFDMAADNIGDALKARGAGARQGRRAPRARSA